MAGLLDGEVRLVLMQFVFSSLKLVPSCLKQKPAKMPKKILAVKGEQFLDATEDVSISVFLCDLKKVGYGLVDAYYQIREDGKATVCFMFADKEHITLSEEFKETHGSAERALLQILEQSMWRARAFLNPFFKEGIAVKDVYAISVNLDGRQPLIGDDGQPVLRWQKDENGEKIGDCPIPLEPKRFLRIINNDIRVLGLA